MGRGGLSRRRKITGSVGFTAVACLLAAVTAGPANAQAPDQAPTPLAQVAESVSGATEQVAAAVEPVSGETERVAATVAEPVSGATGQVAAAVEPVSEATERLAAAAAAPASRATEQVAAAAEPVTRATERIAAAAQPVTQATGRVVRAAEPILDATRRVAGAAKPVLDATGRVAGAAKPVLDATTGVAGSVTAPAVRLGGAAARLGDVVEGVTRPVGGALTGDRSSRPDRGGTGQPGATFGRPGSGGPPNGPAAGSGSERPAAGGLYPEGLRGAAPETSPDGATFVPFSTAPDAAPDQALNTVASDRHLPTPVPDRPVSAPPVTEGHLSGPVWPGLGEVLAAPSPETSTSTSRTDHRPRQTSPERLPTPAPSAPPAAAAAGAASSASAGPLLALLVLLLMAAPSLSLFFRTVPEFLRPAPFVVALERPG
jgi:hypothetical protein